MHNGLNNITAKFGYYTISGLDFIGGGPPSPPPGCGATKKPELSRVKV